MLRPHKLPRAFACALAAASLALPAFAQAEGQSITLAEALALAEQNAPILAEASAGVDAARGRNVQAALGPNPQLRLNVENASGSGAYRGLDLAETTLAVGQTIELGGKREARMQAGNADLSAAGIRAAIARANLTRDVKQAFSNALAAREQVALAQAAVDRARSLAGVSQQLVDAGREPPLRALRARSAASEAEAELERLRFDEISTRAALAAILGETTANFTVAGVFDAAPYIHSLIDPSQSLDVKLAEAEATFARALVSRERAAAATDLDVELGVRRFEESSETAIVFGASLPIPVFNQNQGAIAAAGADANAADARRLQALADAVRRIREAEGALAAAESRVAMLETSASPAALEALTLARAGFEAGRFSLLDVLDAEEGYASAQSALIVARRDRMNAVASLERALARQGG